MARLLSSLFLFGAMTTALGQTIKLVNPPTEVKLNDRKHPIVVDYAGVNGDVSIHIPTYLHTYIGMRVEKMVVV